MTCKSGRHPPFWDRRSLYGTPSVDAWDRICVTGFGLVMAFSEGIPQRRRGLPDALQPTPCWSGPVPVAARGDAPGTSKRAARDCPAAPAL